MIRTAWRLLLTCVLIVTLQGKGIVAAGMTGCGLHHALSASMGG